MSEQPEALRLADILDEPEAHYPGNFDTPKRANAFLSGLAQEASDNEIEDVVVAAYDKDGYLILLSSHMTRAEAAFMLHKAQLWAYDEFKG